MDAKIQLTGSTQPSSFLPPKTRFPTLFTEREQSHFGRSLAERIGLATYFSINKDDHLFTSTGYSGRLRTGVAEMRCDLRFPQA